MNLAGRINSSDKLTDLPIDAESASQLDGILPITATPAALAGGVAAGAALAGAAAAGAAIGEATD